MKCKGCSEVVDMDLLCSECGLCFACCQCEEFTDHEGTVYDDDLQFLQD